MNRITIILTAACLLAASTLALNPTTAHAKGHSAAKSHAATQNHATPVTKAIQHNAQPAIQHIAKKSPKITTANTKLLTLAKKGPSNLKKFKPASKKLLVAKLNHHRHADFVWSFGAYLGYWQPGYTANWSYDSLNDDSASDAAQDSSDENLDNASETDDTDSAYAAN